MCYSKQKLEKYWISLAGVLIRDNKCLIMEPSNSPGKWDIPGGRIDIGENYNDALIRELKEEVGFVNVVVQGVVDYDIWYTEKRNLPICAIAHLISTEETDLILSHEHLSYEWVTREDLKKYTFVWPAAQRMIEKGFEKYNELKKYE